MEISIPSLFVCTLSLTLFTGILFVIVSRSSLLYRVGIKSVYLFTLLILLHGCLPIDFSKIHLTKSFYSENLLAQVHNIARTVICKLPWWNVRLLDFIVIIWISGALIFLGKRILGYRSQKLAIERNASCLSAELRQIFETACLEVFGKSKNYRIIVLDGLSSAATYGFFHPVILLPGEEYSSSELHLIFLHELCHIKCNDFLLKWICDIISAIYWWNPILSLALPALMQQIQELHIDYLVNYRAARRERVSYLKCLYKTAMNHPANAGNTKSKMLYSFGEKSSEIQLNQRVQFIMNMYRPKEALLVLALLILLIFSSWTFVFEASHIPDYDEHGHKVFYLDEKNSYYVKNGNQYDLYLSGEYVYTNDIIIEDFENLPIYESEPK